MSLIIDVGYVDASEHRGVAIPVPPDPVLHGAPVGLQALSGNVPSLALAFSTPAIVVLR
jgi:hypothetical protein